MMIDARQKQFSAAIKALPAIHDSARIAENFGFSNSSRIVEGGLFACTNNLETYSRKLRSGEEESTQLVLLCVLTFPPDDELYFAIVISAEMAKVHGGLIKLAKVVEQRNHELEKQGKRPGKINNNVKFFLTSSGKVYFDNEFLDGVKEEELDPDLLVTVDDIYCAIWPPTFSSRRVYLAQEFVRYLDGLVGNERVHELTVWGADDALPASMRRLPKEIEIRAIESAVQRMGGHYPAGEIGKYHAGLNFLDDKHFVILSGLSGTGKTNLALQYARAVHGLTDERAQDPLLFVCPVRPEWTDPSGLTGYYDVLANQYFVPPFLEAVMIASANRSSPVFVVLDEMNLARVEYYLADVLSCIEARQPLQLHAHGGVVTSNTGVPVPASIRIPPNLYITGTINIDETTNPVSDKVLDRAIVIDMSQVELDGYLHTLKGNVDLAASAAAVQPALTVVHGLLQKHGLGFGYRVAREVVHYHNFATRKLGLDTATVTDDLMVQKVLVKLRGTEKHRLLLNSLLAELKGPKSQALLSRLVADLDEFGSFQCSR